MSCTSVSRRLSHGRGIRELLATFAALVALCVAGCDPSADGKSVAGADKSPADGDLHIVSGKEAGKELLNKMVAAYRDAKGYQDHGTLNFSVSINGQKQTNKLSFATQMAKPNKLRLDAFSTIVVSDGKTIRGKVNSPETNDFDSQIVELPAPEKLSDAELNGIAQAMAGMFVDPNFGSPLPLGMLLNGKWISDLVKKADRVAMLPSQTIDGHACRGVQFEDDVGRTVWWVDEQSYVLRRFEFPMNALAKSQNVSPSELSAIADFTGASFTAPADDQFVMEMPAKPKIVKYLVELPRTIPAELLGKRTPSFTFRTLDGKEITNRSLTGKVVVLVFWTATDERTVREILPTIDKTVAKLTGNANVSIIAATTDPVNIVTDEQLKQIADNLKLSMTVARADDASVAPFKLQALPTTLFIGKDSTLHDLHQGYVPQAVAQIPALVQALLDNKALYARALGQYEEERRGYEERLVVAKTGKVPTAPVAAKTAPKRHRLTSLWKTRDVKNAGNLLAHVSAEPNLPTANSQIFAIEDYRNIARLDQTGKVVERHLLKLPEGYAITMIRSAMGQDGKRYYACSTQQLPKVFVFDEQWKMTCEYPSGPVAANEDNPQVGDVELSDIDGDGEIDILIGYLGLHGLHCISPKGESRFRSRSLSAVSRIAVTETARQGRRSIFAATLGGPVVEVDWRGREVGRWTAQAGPLPFLGTLATRASNDPAMGNASALFGIAMPKPGSYAAVGVDAAGATAWEYPLPDGRHQTAIEPVTYGQLVGDAPHWIIEGPDGSIHLLAGDGKLLEQFNLGIALTGIAAGNIGGKPALIVSSAEGIEALRLESVESVPQGEPGAGELQR